MTIEFSCGGCGQRLAIGDEFAGQRVACGKCQALLEAPVTAPPPPSVSHRFHSPPRQAPLMPPARRQTSGLIPLEPELGLIPLGPEPGLSPLEPELELLPLEPARSAKTTKTTPLASAPPPAPPVALRTAVPIVRLYSFDGVPIVQGASQPVSGGPPSRASGLESAQRPLGVLPTSEGVGKSKKPSRRFRADETLPNWVYAIGWAFLALLVLVGMSFIPGMALFALGVVVLFSACIIAIVQALRDRPQAWFYILFYGSFLFMLRRESVITALCGVMLFLGGVWRHSAERNAEYYRRQRDFQEWADLRRREADSHNMQFPHVPPGFSPPPSFSPPPWARPHVPPTSESVRPPAPIRPARPEAPQ